MALALISCMETVIRYEIKRDGITWASVDTLAEAIAIVNDIDPDTCEIVKTIKEIE